MNEEREHTTSTEVPASASGGGGRWHETRDVSPAAMGWLALGFVLVLVFLSIAGALYYHALSTHLWKKFGPLEEPVPQNEARFPGPELQSKPALDLVHFREREEYILGSYGRVDRNAGIVRIPIDRAMELEAQRGEPVRQGPPGPTWTDMMRQRAEEGAQAVRQGVQQPPTPGVPPPVIPPRLEPPPPAAPLHPEGPVAPPAASAAPSEKPPMPAPAPPSQNQP